MDRPPSRFVVQATNAPSGRQWRDTVGKVEDLGYAPLAESACDMTRA
ncbi:hypothetical protein X011_01950 [Mycobacterium tuberculosis variant microti OV254]|nr:hypothetical protein X011_01950 [Mycobacterium tuberculosis variant microti OV254]